jgi:hypothetical protein
MFSIFALFPFFFCIVGISDLYAESYVVHVSSYQNEDDAVSNRKLLEKNHFPAFVKKLGFEGKGIWYRVLVGPYPDYDKAVNIAGTLIHRKFATYVKVMPDCGFKYISKKGNDYTAQCIGGKYDGSVYTIKKSGNVFRAVPDLSVISDDSEGASREEAGYKACGCR